MFVFARTPEDQCGAGSQLPCKAPDGTYEHMPVIPMVVTIDAHLRVSPRDVIYKLVGVIVAVRHRRDAGGPCRSSSLTTRLERIGRIRVGPASPDVRNSIWRL